EPAQGLGRQQDLARRSGAIRVDVGVAYLLAAGAFGPGVLESTPARQAGDPGFAPVISAPSILVIHHRQPADSTRRSSAERAEGQGTTKQVRKSFLTLGAAHGSLGTEVDTMTSLHLTRWQRLRLQRQLEGTPDARVYRRTLAVLEYSRGQPVAHIAQALGVTRQSVYNWVEAYTQAHDPSALGDDERSGRPSQWTEDVRAFLQALLAQTPDQRGYFAVNWTVPLLQEEIARGTGQSLSGDTLRRELDRLG